MKVHRICKVLLIYGIVTSELRRGRLLFTAGAVFVAKDLQVNACLHANSFADRKNMEHEARNVRLRNRAGVSLLDFIGVLV